MENQNNAAQVITDIGLPELRDVLKAACLSGEPVTLSHLAAGALHYVMTTGVPLPPLTEAPVPPLSTATDEELAGVAHRHQGERIYSTMEVARMSSLAPAHAAKMDLARRVCQHLASTTAIDPVTAGKVAVDIVAMLDAAPGGPQYMEDPVDIIRTLLCTVDHYWSLPEEKREAYPSPTAEFSPLMQAARRACVERGFTTGGLAIDTGAPTTGTSP
jgi:hypothetical protein